MLCIFLSAVILYIISGYITSLVGHSESRDIKTIFVLAVIVWLILLALKTSLDFSYNKVLMDGYSSGNDNF